MIQIDPLTNEKFTPRRFNQKFASKRNQISFNNIKARRKRIDKAPFDLILDKNRTILIRIVGNDKEVVVSKDYLLGAGFNFQFFNRSFESNDIKYQCVYRYAVGLLGNGRYKVLRIA